MVFCYFVVVFVIYCFFAIMVFRYSSVELWEIHSRYRNNFNGQVLGNGYGLSNDTHMTPNFTRSLPVIWGRKREKTGKSYFPFSNDKTLLQSCSDQQLPAAKFFFYMFWRQSWKAFRNRCIFTLFTTMSVHISPWHYVPSAVFPKRSRRWKAH